MTGAPNNEQIANQPNFMKKQAKAALKAAKALEKEQMVEGAIWVNGPNRSKILMKRKRGA